MEKRAYHKSFYGTWFLSCLLFACQPSSTTPLVTPSPYASRSSVTSAPQNIPMTSNSVNPDQKSGQGVNPIQKEGQILIKLQIETAKVPGLEKAAKDERGFLKSDSASFSIKRSNGPDLAGGQVKDNQITVSPEVLGVGPYEVRVKLQTGETLLSKLNDTLYPNDIRILRAENIIVESNTHQTCTGDGCTQNNNNQTNVDIGGNNCPGSGNTCSSDTK